MVLLDDTARLFTDGRYIEAARAVDGVDVVHAERDLFGDLAKRLPELVEGPVAFEAEHLSVAQHTKLAGGGATFVPATQSVERLRAVKDADRARGRAPLGAPAERGVRAPGSRAGRAVGPRPRSPGGWSERSASSEPRRCRSRRSWRAGRTQRCRTIIPATGSSRWAMFCWSMRAPSSTATAPTARGRSPSARWRPPCGAPTTFASRRSCARSTRSCAGAAAQAVDAVARGIIREHGYDVMHGLGHGVGLAIHEEPRLAETSADQLAVSERRHGRARRVSGRARRRADRGHGRGRRERQRGADARHEGARHSVVRPCWLAAREVAGG